MIDPRTQKLAKLVVNYFLKVKHNTNVTISGSTEASDFIKALYKEVLIAGAHPFLRVSLPGLDAAYFKHAKEHHLKKFPEISDMIAKNSQYYIGIATTNNTCELSTVDPKKLACRQAVTREITNYIVNERDKIRRATVGYPCEALAQVAEMSLEEYENFVFGAEIQDWDKIGKQIKRTLDRFKKGKHVHLIGENVDLQFDIHGEKAGDDLEGDNVPCGEIFMAPVRDSLEGYIKFDYPLREAGKEMTDIYLKFKKGKVVDFDATKHKDFLKELLETDKNSSYVGEFGIGMNPKITRFTNNLLFDEKIGGTIHLALGMAYKENGGGNDSAVHLDIVKNMKKAQIILDGKVVQEKGIWKI
jgi:aminopeptidase